MMNFGMSPEARYMSFIQPHPSADFKVGYFGNYFCFLPSLPKRLLCLPELLAGTSLLQ
jgi:hypothetical protein